MNNMSRPNFERLESGGSLLAGDETQVVLTQARQTPLSPRSSLCQFAQNTCRKHSRREAKLRAHKHSVLVRGPQRTLVDLMKYLHAVKSRPLW